MMQKIIHIIVALFLLLGQITAMTHAQEGSVDPLYGFEILENQLVFQYDSMLPLSSVKAYGTDGLEMETGFTPVGGKEIMLELDEEEAIVVAFMGSIYGDVSTIEAARANDASYYEVQLTTSGGSLAVDNSSIIHSLDTYELTDEGIVNFALSADITASGECEAGSRLSCVKGLSTGGLINENNGIDEEQLGILSGNNAAGGGNLLFLVTNIINSVFLLLGFTAVALIILEGVLLILSRGDEERRKKVIGTIMNIGIGFAVILLSYAIVTTILNVVGGDRLQRNDQQVATVAELERDNGINLLRGSGGNITADQEYVDYVRPTLQYKAAYDEIAKKVQNYVSDYRPLDAVSILAEDLVYSVTRGQALDVLKEEWNTIKNKRFGLFVSGAKDVSESVSVWVAQGYENAKSGFAKIITPVKGTHPQTKAQGLYYDLSTLDFKEGVDNPNIIHIQNDKGEISHFTVVIRREGEELVPVYIPGQPFADYKSIITGKVNTWGDVSVNGYNRELSYFDIQDTTGNGESRTFTTGGTVQLNPGYLNTDVEVKVTINDTNQIDPSRFKKILHEVKRSDGELIAREAEQGTSFTIRVPNGTGQYIIDDIAGVTTDGKIVDLGSNSIHLLNQSTPSLFAQSALANIHLEGTILDGSEQEQRKIFSGDYITLPKIGDGEVSMPTTLKYYSNVAPTLIEFTSSGLKDGAVRYVDGDIAKDTSSTDTLGGVVPYKVTPDLRFTDVGLYNVRVSVRDYQLSRTLATFDFKVHVVGDGTKLEVSPRGASTVGSVYTINTRPTFSENSALTAKRVEIARVRDDGSTEQVTSRALTRGQETFDYLMEQDGAYLFTLVNTFGSAGSTEVSENRIVLPEAPQVNFNLRPSSDGGNVFELIDTSTNVETSNILVTTSPIDPGLTQSEWLEQDGRRVKKLTFSQAGNYQVKVTARGTYGETATSSRAVNVANTLQYNISLKSGTSGQDITSATVDEVIKAVITGKNIAKVEIKDNGLSLATLRPTGDVDQNASYDIQIRDPGSHTLQFEFYGVDNPNTIALRVPKSLSVFASDVPMAGINVFGKSGLLTASTGRCTVNGAPKEAYVLNTTETYSFDASNSTSLFGQSINASTNGISYLWSIDGTQVSNSSFRVSKRFSNVTLTANTCTPIQLQLTEVKDGVPKTSEQVIYAFVENRAPTYTSFIASYPTGVLKTPFTLPVKIIGLQDLDHPNEAVEVQWFYEIDGVKLGTELSSTSERLLYIDNYGNPGETYTLKAGATIADKDTGETMTVYTGTRGVTIGEKSTLGVEIQSPQAEGGYTYVPWIVGSNRISIQATAALSNGDVLANQSIAWTSQRIGRYAGCESNLESLPKSLGSTRGQVNVSFDRCGVYRIRAKSTYQGEEAIDDITIRVYPDESSIPEIERTNYQSQLSLHGSAGQVAVSTTGRQASFFLEQGKASGTLSNVINGLESLGLAKSTIIELLRKADSDIATVLDESINEPYEVVRQKLLVAYGNKNVTIDASEEVQVAAGDAYKELLAQGYSPETALGRIFNPDSEQTYTPLNPFNTEGTVSFTPVKGITEGSDIYTEIGLPSTMIDQGSQYDPGAPVNASFYWAYDFYSTLGLPSDTIYENISEHSLDFSKVYGDLGTADNLHTQQTRANSDAVTYDIAVTAPLTMTVGEARKLYSAQGLSTESVSSIIGDAEGSVEVAPLAPLTLTFTELYESLIAQGFTPNAAITKVLTDNPYLVEIGTDYESLQAEDEVLYRPYGLVKLQGVEYVKTLSNMGFSPTYIVSKAKGDNEMLDSANVEDLITLEQVVYRPSTPAVLSLGEYISELRRLGLPSSAIYKKMITDNPELSEVYKKMTEDGVPFYQRYEFLMAEDESMGLRFFPKKPVMLTGAELLNYSHQRFPSRNLRDSYLKEVDSILGEAVDRVATVETEDDAYQQLRELIGDNSYEVNLYAPITLSASDFMVSSSLQGLTKAEILSVMKRIDRSYLNSSVEELDFSDSREIRIPQGVSVSLSEERLRQLFLGEVQHESIVDALLGAVVGGEMPLILPRVANVEMSSIRMYEEGFAPEQWNKHMFDAYPEISELTAEVLSQNSDATIPKALSQYAELQHVPLVPYAISGTQAELAAMLLRKGIDTDSILVILSSISKEMNTSSLTQNGLTSIDIVTRLLEQKSEKRYHTSSIFQLPVSKAYLMYAHLGFEFTEINEILKAQLGRDLNESSIAEGTEMVSVNISPLIAVTPERAKELLLLWGREGQVLEEIATSSGYVKPWTGIAMAESSLLNMRKYYDVTEGTGEGDIYYPGSVEIVNDASSQPSYTVPFGSPKVMLSVLPRALYVGSDLIETALQESYPSLYDGQTVRSGVTSLSLVLQSTKTPYGIEKYVFQELVDMDRGVESFFSGEQFLRMTYDRLLRLPGGVVATLANELVSKRKTLLAYQDSVPDTISISEKIAEAQTAVQSTEILRGTAGSSEYIRGYGIFDETALFNCSSLGEVMLANGVSHLVCHERGVYMDSMDAFLAKLSSLDIENTLKSSLEKDARLFDERQDNEDKKIVLARMYETVNDENISEEMQKELRTTLQFIIVGKVQLGDVLSTAVKQVQDTFKKHLAFASTTNKDQAQQDIQLLSSLALESERSNELLVRLLSHFEGRSDKLELLLVGRTSAVYAIANELDRDVYAEQLSVLDEAKGNMVGYLTALAAALQSIEELPSAVNDRTLTMIKGLQQEYISNINTTEAEVGTLSNEISLIIGASAMPEIYMEGYYGVLESYLKSTTVTKEEKTSMISTLNENTDRIVVIIENLISGEEFSVGEKQILQSQVAAVKNTQDILSKLSTINTLVKTMRLDQSGYGKKSLLQGYRNIALETIKGIQLLRPEARLSYSTPALREKLSNIVENLEGGVDEEVMSNHNTLLAGQLVSMSEILSDAGLEALTLPLKEELASIENTKTGMITSFAVISEFLSTLKSEDLLSQELEVDLVMSLQAYYLEELQALRRLVGGQSLQTSATAETLDTRLSFLAKETSLADASYLAFALEKEILSSQLEVKAKKNLIVTMYESYPIADLLDAASLCTPLYIKDGAIGVKRVCLEDTSTSRDELVSSEQLKGLIELYVNNDQTLSKEEKSVVSTLLASAMNTQDVRKAVVALSNITPSSTLVLIPVIGDAWQTYLSEQYVSESDGSMEETMRGIMTRARELSTREKAVVREGLLQVQRGSATEDDGLVRRGLFVSYKVINDSSLSPETKNATVELLAQLGKKPQTVDIDVLSPEASLALLEENTLEVRDVDARGSIQADLMRLKESFATESTLATAGYAKEIQGKIERSTNLSQQEKNALGFNALTVAEYLSYVSALETGESTDQPSISNPTQGTPENTDKPGKEIPQNNGDTPLLITVFWWIFIIFIILVLLAAALGGVLYALFLRYKAANPEIHVDFEEFILITRERLAGFFGKKDGEGDIPVMDEYQGLPTMPQDPLLPEQPGTDSIQGESAPAEGEIQRKNSSNSEIHEDTKMVAPDSTPAWLTQSEDAQGNVEQKPLGQSTSEKASITPQTDGDASSVDVQKSQGDIQSPS